MILNKRIIDFDDEQYELIEDLFLMVDKVEWTKAKKMSANLFLDQLGVEKLEKIDKTGNVSTWRFTFNNGQTSDFTVTDGDQAKELDRRLEICLIGQTSVESLIGGVEDEIITEIVRLKNIYSLSLVLQGNPYTTINIRISGVDQAVPIYIPQGDYSFNITYETGKSSGTIQLLTEKAV